MKKIMLIGILFSMGISFNAIAEEVLFCDETNYKEFIYKKRVEGVFGEISENMDRLIRKTGKGCDFRRLDLIKNSIDFATALGKSLDLRRSDFSGLNLNGVVMGAVDFMGSDFRRANLKGFTFRTLFLGATALLRAKYDEWTIFPPEGENHTLDLAKHSMMINCSDPKDEEEREACEN